MIATPRPTRTQRVSRPLPLIVRPAQYEDVSGVIGCLTEAFAPYRSVYTAEAYADTVLTPATFEARLHQMTILVARSSTGAVVGTVGYRMIAHGHGHLRGMAVQPALQGLGIAELLLRSAEEGLYDLGCRRVTLNSTAALQRAMTFYERRGYRGTGRTREWHGMMLFEYEKALG